MNETIVTDIPSMLAYVETMLEENRRLDEQATTLRSKLEHFSEQCSGYSGGIDGAYADQLSDYVEQNLTDIDFWLLGIIENIQQQDEAPNTPGDEPFDLLSWYEENYLEIKWGFDIIFKGGSRTLFAFGKGGTIARIRHGIETIYEDGRYVNRVQHPGAYYTNPTQAHTPVRPRYVLLSQSWRVPAMSFYRSLVPDKPLTRSLFVIDLALRIPKNWASYEGEPLYPRVVKTAAATVYDVALSALISAVIVTASSYIGGAIGGAAGGTAGAPTGPGALVTGATGATTGTAGGAVVGAIISTLFSVPIANSINSTTPGRMTRNAWVDTVAWVLVPSADPPGSAGNEPQAAPA